MEPDDTLKLRKPSDVYHEIYKEARRKAKEAKHKAIQAYLEAKNIKDTYSLNDLDSSEDEFDYLTEN